MPIDQRLKSRVLPVKPLASGKNRDKRPSVLFSADQLGSDIEDDPDEDPVTRMDRLMQNAKQEREGGRSSYAIKLPEAPTYQAPVYTPPVYPGPPGSIPPPNFSSGSSNFPGTTIGAPTFEYKSVYTNESMQFSAKQYDTTSTQGGTPVPSFPIMGSSTGSYPAPNLQSLEKKTFAIPPSSTKNMVVPESPFSKGQLPQTTTANSKTMTFKDDTTPSGDLSPKTARKLKLQEALKLKAQLQAEKEKHDQQKISGLTPEQLEEKRKLDQEKLDQELATKALNKLEEEAQTLKSQIDQVQTEIQQFSAKNQKLAEIQIRYQQALQEIASKKDQASREQSNMDMELAMMQSELTNLRNQNQVLSETNSQVKSDRDANNKLLQTLNEERQNLILNIGDDQSMLNQLNEQLETCEQTKSQALSEKNLTASQLEEIRTTGVILDPFLQAKIEEAKKKQQVAHAELNTNELRLADLDQKLDAANQQEKDQEQESEKMYKDVEVMCQAKDDLQEQIKNQSEKKISIQAVLNQIQETNFQLQNILSSRQKYNYDVSSTLQRSSEELLCQQKIRDILFQINQLDICQNLDDINLKKCEETLKTESEELQIKHTNLNSEIETQEQANLSQSQINNDLVQEINGVEQQLKLIFEQVSTLDANQESENKMLDLKNQTHQQEENEKLSAENILIDAILSRVALFNQAIEEKSTDTARFYGQLNQETDQTQLIETEQLNLQNSITQQLEQSKVYQESIKSKTAQQQANSEVLGKLNQYINSFDEMLQKSQEGILELKNQRLAEISEALTLQLQLEQYEQKLNQQKASIEIEISETHNQISLYEEAKIQLTLRQDKHQSLVSTHQDWIVSSNQEFDELQNTKTQLESDQQQTKQNLDEETNVLQNTKQKLQQTTQLATEHEAEITTLQSLLSDCATQEQQNQLSLRKISSELQQEKVLLQQETNQKDEQLANMVQTDPEFSDKVQNLNDLISKAEKNFDYLTIQQQKIDTEVEKINSDIISSTTEFEDIKAKLVQLNLEQQKCIGVNSQQQLQKQNLTARNDFLQSQFSISESKLKNIEQYLQEIGALMVDSNDQVRKLRHQRVAEIEEAIKDKLDTEQREKQADQELADLQVQIQEVQSEIRKFLEAQTHLSKAQEQISQHESDYENWKQTTADEHQNHLQEFTTVSDAQSNTTTEINNLIEINEKLMTTDYSTKNSVQELESQIIELNQTQINHFNAQLELQKVLVTNTDKLNIEKDSQMQEQSEIQSLKLQTPQEDLEFGGKIIEITKQVDSQKISLVEKETELADLLTQLENLQQEAGNVQSQIEEETMRIENQNKEQQTLQMTLDQNQSEFESLAQKSRYLQEALQLKIDNHQNLIIYNKECESQHQNTTQSLDQLRKERLQELEKAIEENLENEKLFLLLEKQIQEIEKEIKVTQSEITQYSEAQESINKKQIELNELQLQLSREQQEWQNQNLNLSSENDQMVKDFKQLQQLVEFEQEKLITITQQISEQKTELASFEDLFRKQLEISQAVGTEFSFQTEKYKSQQEALLQGKKELNESESQYFELLNERLKIIEQESQAADFNFEELNTKLETANNQQKILEQEANSIAKTENQDFNRSLKNKLSDINQYRLDSQQSLENLIKYEHDLIEVQSKNNQVLLLQQNKRLEEIYSIKEKAKVQVEESVRATSAVQPVNTKRRHVRNQSLIGNDLANSTFDSTQQSNISGAELEQKVKEALDKDSQGQKVTITDMMETSKYIIEEEPNDDEFFSDQMIERKRSSERGRRSSSSDKEHNESEPQSQFTKDNQLRKLKWANPTLRHIDECSEEQLVSEYGSEVGGHEFGRSGSGIFGLSTTQRLINKSNKLNQFGVVGPQQDQQIAPSNHTRNESAGSVQVPLSEEHVEETSINSMPTVPVPMIVPVARPSETRPSIFDMQRKSSTQSSYRATTYDKLAPTKRIANALKQKLGIGFSENAHTEENVLGDLLVCLLAQKQILSVQSDFEMNQGFALFEQMLKDDPKCHEGMFGLGRINYIQGRYEIAEKWLMKAYEVKRDFAYRVWLGYTQMQLYRVCTSENPKKMKFVQNAIANLDRCAKEVKVGVYASFALLYLSLQLQTMGMQVKGLQDPNYYESQIRGYSTQVDLYEGELASAIIKLATNQASTGVKQLQELLVKDRPHAYYVLIHYYLRTNDLIKARQTADDAFNKLTGYENFQERLMITLLLCKCYYKTGNHAKLLVTLQNQLLESPHFSSLLYVYGKYIIQSFKLADYLQSAISALQECMRVSCQVRKAKCAYWLSLAYQATGQMTQCGLNQYIYVNEIKQVVKSGPIQVRSVKSRVNVNVQRQIKDKVSNFNQPIQMYAQDLLFTRPQQSLKGQMSDPDWPEDADLTNACQRIPQQRDQLLYQSITLYKIRKEFSQADQLLMTLSREHPEDFEIQAENANFLRVAIRNQFKPQRPETPKQEALKLLDMLETCEIQGDLWANAHIQCAKLLSVIAYQSDDFNLQLKAFECLLKMKNTLPVIDTKIAGVKLPGTVSRYLFEEFDHVDFQANAQVQEEEKDGQTEFKPQDDYDQTNKFFSQSVYFQTKLKACPLATLSIAEIKDQVRIKGDTLFFFGAAQTELAYQAEEVSKELQENNISEPHTAKIYYRSSTPLICVIKYLQHIRWLNSNHQEVIPTVLPEAVRDVGFCIFSDPDWLYQIAKMCIKWNVFIDLAVHSIQLYLQLVNYYRNFYPTEILDTKGQLLLAEILLKSSTNLADDKPQAEVIAKQLSAKVDQTIELAKQVNNQRALKAAIKNQENLKQIQLLLK